MLEEFNNNYEASEFITRVLTSLFFERDYSGGKHKTSLLGTFLDRCFAVLRTIQKNLIL